MPSISPLLLEKLREIEQDQQATFTLSGFCARSSSGSSYYVKIGSQSSLEQYQGEAKSLEMIENASPGLAPHLFSTDFLPQGDGEVGKEKQVYWISEYKYLQPMNANHRLELANRLATELHAYESEDGFGFECATYCGATRTQGRSFDAWPACFADMINSLLGQLRNKSSYKEVVQLGDEIVAEVIPFLLGDPLEVKPVLLHGDLWSGNVGVDSKTDKVVIYDPASLFGHNEAELSIMRMFGGFTPEFFEEYHKHRPKSHPVSEYEQRQTLYELFHYLNHTCIFNGQGYAQEAKSRCRQLLAFVRTHKGPRL